MMKPFPTGADGHTALDTDARIANIATMRAIWDPLAQGESDDMDTFFDALADDVHLSTSAGDLQGKDALVRYFSTPSPNLTFNPFETPLEYYGEGDKVVIVGQETFTRVDTGSTHRAPWAWVMEMAAGRIRSILAVQDLGGIADIIGAKLREAQGGPRAIA